MKELVDGDETWKDSTTSLRPDRKRARQLADLIMFVSNLSNK
jgi:hypothetical protein